LFGSGLIDILQRDKHFLIRTVGRGIPLNISIA
jgi:hypothetical protein